MAQITIIPSDGRVYVDGVAHEIDLSDMDANIHAIQFDQGSGSGHIEYVGNALPNKPLGKTAFRIFEKYVNRWKAAEAPPERTLADAKADKRQQINGTRDTLEQSGFPYLGKIIDSNSVSVQRLTIVVQSAQAAIAVGAPFSVDWTCQDNSVLTMDAAAVMGMPPALAMFANGLHQHARDKKALIEAATTIGDVDAIVW